MAQAEMQKNKKSSQKIRFNIVDLVLIIAVLACITGVYLRYHFSENFGVNHELGKYEITFRVKNIRYTSADAFPAGDTVYLSTQNKLIGTMIGLDSASPSQTVYTDYNGNVKQIYYPEDSRIDVTGRILSHGSMTERGYLLDGNTFLAPGASYLVETPHLTVNITILEILPAAEEF